MSLGHLRCARILCAGLALLAVLHDARVTRAAPRGASSPIQRADLDAETLRARELFATGTALARRMQWAEALSMFQEVALLHPHPSVTFNVAICERALGRYTRARASFSAVLEASRTEDVAASIVEEARTFQREIDGLLVRVHFTLEPHPGTHLLVDGRPLSADGAGRFVVGSATESDHDVVAEGTFELVLDPGTHIFHAARDGYTDVVLNHSFPPAYSGELGVALERLPARVHVDSTVSLATVIVNGAIVGQTPIDVQRPAGTYHLQVRKAGFVTYESTVVLNAGGRTDLTARLSPASKPITSKWWFWTAAVGAVATGALVTYGATRPSPEPPPYNGGGTGWVAVAP